MSLFSSFIIDPVVRQARRLSSAASPAASDNEHRQALSHANRIGAHTTPSALLDDAHEDYDENSSNSHAQSASVGSDIASPAIDTHSPSSQGPHAVAGEEARDDDGTVRHPSSTSRPITAPTAPIAIPSHVAMSASPSNARLQVQPRRLHSESTIDTPHVQGLASPAAQNALAMSESLPADDGMRHLRARIHEIRDMSIGDVDKARMMHSIMTERYNYMRPTSPSSFISHDRPFTPTSSRSVFSDVHYSSPVSAASDVDSENPYNLRPGDTEPTYRPRPSPLGPEAVVEEEDGDAFEEDAPLGCQHYKRNVKVQCYACRRWYTCRHCHDAEEDHNLDRKKTQNMLCMACGTPQKAAEYCNDCGIQAACYYCDICKLWDNNSSKKIYHCADCGICRRGEGLGKDYVHCKVCLEAC